MDDFRKLQKAQCLNAGNPHGVNTYGCPCCRCIGNLPKFKKLSRKLAKHRLRQQDKKAVLQEV